MQIGEYRLDGGGACPEQYDVFRGETEVGYLRLRHGRFRAEVPFGGKIVYTAAPNGDGSFDDDERMKYLTEAIQAIDSHLKTSKLPKIIIKQPGESLSQDDINQLNESANEIQPNKIAPNSTEQLGSDC